MSTAPAPRPFEIHRAGWAELDQVMEVMRSAFDPSFGEAWTRAQCAGILPMPGVTLTLATVGGEGAGFSLVRAVADESELLLLAVAPECRGAGIGTGLLEQFIDQGRTNGVHKLHLEVRESNPAVALYAGHDFRIAGRRSQYYRGKDGKKHDALTMVRLI